MNARKDIAAVGFVRRTFRTASLGYTRTREGSVATASQWKMSAKSAASTKNSPAGVVPRTNRRPSKVC